VRRPTGPHPPTPPLAPGERAAAGRGTGQVRRTHRAPHRPPGGRPDHQGRAHALFRGGVAGAVLRWALRGLGGREGLGGEKMSIQNGSSRLSRVLLLGGTSEIGLAILSALRLEPGTEVILAGRDAQRLEAAGKALNRAVTVAR